MSIAILPARLANQIAAGEVVERPASVVKELVENSLDAGATRIQIDIEKGGAKRIRISDNGSGIAKDELTLALSRHATSKIKNLDDLEAISSLGFRGEALASISSVARLTLTSKPAAQDAAWQAQAQGREMEVAIQPAAHPDGTTIDVADLFFNTPARRKFLRTEKTEFSHIEEVIKRIALAKFDVTFVLNHNHKMVKTYRAVNDQSQYMKRIAAVCGQSFVNNAIEINCQHDDIHLWGCLAAPSYVRKQNDLCYSYVNERMMRDKLINHAIRQAYGEFIENDVYPAFVLFLSVDFKEVDVNVHPAKHEVRFHQSRYVHDFIYSVCHKALVENCTLPSITQDMSMQSDTAFQQSASEREYIQPLQKVSDYHTPSQAEPLSTSQASYHKPLAAVSYQRHNAFKHNTTDNVAEAADNYQKLMTPLSAQETNNPSSAELLTASASVHNASAKTTMTAASHSADNSYKLLTLHQNHYLLYQHENSLKICDAKALVAAEQQYHIQQVWPQGLTSQPLLLPIKMKLSVAQVEQLIAHQALLEQSGIYINLDHGYAQIRQFPALLRAQNVANTIDEILIWLDQSPINQENIAPWQLFLAQLTLPEQLQFSQVQQAWLTLESHTPAELLQVLELNSATVDLTSTLKQLSSLPIA